jgi:two-component system chemotaxis sensor kinase CheA
VSDLRARLLAAFQVEHKEQLEAIRGLLDKIESRVATAEDREEMFRQAHSLRAAARACDFGTVEALGRRLETLFAQVRKGARHPGKDVLDAVRQALSAIESWGTGLAEERSPPEPVHALTALERILDGPAPAEVGDLDDRLLAAFQVEHREHLEGIRAVLAAVEAGGSAPAGAVDEAFRRAHSLKGAARLTGLHGAEVLAHRLETLFARVREGALELDRPVVRVISQGLDAIEDWAAAVSEQRSPAAPGPALEAIDRVLGDQPEGSAVPAEARSPREPAAAVAAVETVRVRADNLDRLLRSTGQLLTESQRQGLVTRELDGLSRRLAGLEKEWEAVRGSAAAQLRAVAEAPGLGRVAHLLGQVQQEVRALSHQARAVRLLHQRSAWTLRLLGGELQQDVRRVRMVAAESVFQGFRRMVRDLAAGEGKEIDLHVSGLEIEADRAVLQAFKDPLMHMLCNAVSHGIELPEERRAEGKPPAGRIALRLEVEGNRLHVWVEDDGRGIDPAEVAAAAVERGLLSEAEVAATAPDELARLIFRPGFSTSHRVTGLAGRGMGLSVVHEAVARLQGEVRLEPRDGPGTVFVLLVPLSVSTQRLLLVACQGQTFAVPVHAIERLLRVRLAQIETVEGRPMLLLEGQPVPLLSLAALLELGEAAVHVTGDMLPVMILRGGPRRLAVAVDAFLAERDSLLQSLDAPAAHIPQLAGGILLEDGTVVLVLKPAELLVTLQPAGKLPPLRTAAPAPVKKAPRVLVVDDSLTTRTLERSILEAHGYEVRVAVDGVEALDRLRVEPVDLVITDVQMPRMDGFQLLEEIKKDRGLAHLPVIVVTSQERREDQERGLALGADAYIVKRKFDHQDLLDTIGQII